MRRKECVQDSRVHGAKIEVNVGSIYDFYAKRAVERGLHVDAPIVFTAARLKEGSSQRMGSEWDE